jgi:hypothetical protein
MSKIADLRQEFDAAHISYSEARAALEKAFTELLDRYDALIHAVEPGLRIDEFEQMCVRYPGLFRQLDAIYTAQYKFMCETPTTHELDFAAGGMCEILGKLFEGRGRQR